MKRLRNLLRRPVCVCGHTRHDHTQHHSRSTACVRCLCVAWRRAS